MAVGGWVGVVCARVVWRGACACEGVCGVAGVPAWREYGSAAAAGGTARSLLLLLVLLVLLALALVVLLLVLAAASMLGGIRGRLLPLQLGRGSGQLAGIAGQLCCCCCCNRSSLRWAVGLHGGPARKGPVRLAWRPRDAVTE